MSAETDSGGDHFVVEDIPQYEQPAESEGAPFLFRVEPPVWKYVIRMWLIGFVPSILLAIGWSAAGLITDESGPDLGGNLHPAFVFLGVVVLSPVVETLLMGLVLKILSFISRKRYPLAIMSALFWAGLHSLASPPWGLVIAWPFFIFSCSYVAWRGKSWWHAVSITCLIHFLQNLIPGTVLLIAETIEKGW